MFSPLDPSKFGERKKWQQKERKEKKKGTMNNGVVVVMMGKAPRSWETSMARPSRPWSAA